MKSYLVILISMLLSSLVVADTEVPPAERAKVTYTTPTVQVVVPPGDANYVKLFEQYDAGFNDGRGMSDADNTNGQLAWLQSYQMLAYMRMYQATSDTKWLEKVVVQFDRVLECRDDKLGRNDVHAKVPLKGWGTATYDKAGWHVFVVHTGMICQGPAELVQVVKSTPALAKDFGSTATRFLAELEEIVADADQFYKSNDVGEGWYEDAHMGIVPLNMSNAMGSVLVELYKTTGKVEYRQKIKGLATYFKNCLRDNGDATVNWSYWPKTSKDKIERGEDISHAALNVDFAARCADVDIVFNKADLERFANTWLKHVSRDDGTWADYIDGTSGQKPGAYRPQAAGRWLSIARHLSDDLQKQFVDDVRRCFAGQTLLLPSRAIGVAGLAYWAK